MTVVVSVVVTAVVTAVVTCGCADCGLIVAFGQIRRDRLHGLPNNRACEVFGESRSVK